MRGVFDEEEVGRPQSTRDTELTLGSGTLLAIFFGLLLLCGLCFGAGYSMGHRATSNAASGASPQPTPDQEPLQPNGVIPKPSAIAQTPVAAPADAAAADASAASNGAAPAGPAAPAAGGAPEADQAQPQVHPALGQGSGPEQSSAAAPPAVHAALPQPAPAQSLPAQQFMVQIAAVSDPQDAEVLVNALRQRNYPVVARRDPADNYIHVRIGPFASRAIADQWRNKLLNDGYNAVVQP
jgi:DedD protein